MDRDDFALLKVMATTIEGLKEDFKDFKADVKEIKESLRNKVEHEDFKVLKDKVEKLEEHKWTTTGLATGFATAVTFFVSHFFK